MPFYEEFYYDNANNLTEVWRPDVSYDSYGFGNSVVDFYDSEYGNYEYRLDSYGRTTGRTNYDMGIETDYYWTRGTMLSGYQNTGYQKSGYYGSVTNSYSYDENGIRYRKETMQSDDHYGDSHTVRLYYYEGDRLIAESINGDIVYYYYDATGVIGMCYNNTNYYFLKNQFGDILYIVGTGDGMVYAEYRYERVNGRSEAFSFDTYGRMTSRTRAGVTMNFNWTRGTMLAGFDHSYYSSTRGAQVDAGQKYAYDENGLRYKKQTFEQWPDRRAAGLIKCLPLCEKSVII